MTLPTFDHPRAESSSRIPAGLAARAYAIALPFVFLIGALLIFPTTLTVVGILGFLGILGLRWLAFGNPFPRTPINPFLLALLVLFAYGLIVSPLPGTAWMVASYALGGILVLVSVLDRADTMPRLIAAVGILVILGVGFAFGAPFAAQWSGSQGINFAAFTARYFPLLARPSNVNNVAGALEAAVPLAFALIATRAKPWRAIGAFALAPLLLLLLLLQSRGAWLAVLMGVVVYATLYRRWVLPLVPVVLLAGLWLNNAVGDPVPTQALGGGETHDAVTFGERTVIWNEAARVWLHSPLVGVGVNGFAAYGVPVIGTGPQQYEMRGTHSHNLLLQVALDTGLVGTLAFVGILVTAVLAAWRIYRRAIAGSPERALAIGLLASCAIILTHGMFDTIFWGFKAEIFLWGVIALAVVLDRLFKPALMPARGD